MVSDHAHGLVGSTGGGRNREVALPGGGAEPGAAGVGAWATQVAPGFLAGGPDARVQPEPASLRRP
jgi:hypothetical protein